MYSWQESRTLAQGTLPGTTLLLLGGVSLLPVWATPAAPQVVSVVEVQVASQATGTPIPSAEIVVVEVGRSAITDAQGRSRIRGLPPGVVHLRVSALGYGARSCVAEAVNGRTVQVHLSLPPEPLDLPGVEGRAAATRPSLAGIQLRVEELGPGVRDLPQALEKVPGVTVVRRGGPGASAEIQLRGSDSDQVLVLLDGIPLNSPLTGEVDLSTVDLASLQRIVVLPGAQSSRYGSRALSGVILLETRSEEESGAHLNLGGGAWGQREVGGSVTWSPSHTWTVSAGSQWSRGQGNFSYEVPPFRGGGEAERSNSGFQRVSGYARAQKTWKSVATDLRFYASELERGSPGTIAQPSQSARQGHLGRGSSVRIETGERKGGASILAGILWHRGTYRDPDPPVGQPYDQVTRVTQRNLEAEVWRSLGPLELRGGGELRNLEIRSQALDEFPPKVRAWGLWFRSEITRTIPGTTELGLRAGFRLDRHDLVGGLTTSPGLTLSLTRGRTRIQAMYLAGFSPPGLSDLFFHEGVLARPNPDLRPERVQGEVSVALDHSAALGAATLQIRMSAYDADVDDMILWFPDFRFVWSPQNFPVSRRGLEVGFTVAVPLLAHPLLLTGHAHWSQVEYRGGALKSQVAYRPGITAEGEGRWTVGSMEARVAVTHIGSRRTVAGSALNALDPYSLLDAGLSIPASLPGFEGWIDLGASNVLDERTSLLADYPLPGRGWTLGVRIHPGRSP